MRALHLPRLWPPEALLPGCALLLPFAFSGRTLDAFHAWRWSLLALSAALGAMALLFRESRLQSASPRAAAAMPLRPQAAIPPFLAGAVVLFSLLSAFAAIDKAEWAWQTAQTSAWAAWLMVAVFAGRRFPRLWISLRRTAVTAALLGSAYAAGEYWSLWNLTGITENGPSGLHGNRNLLASFQLLLCPWIAWSLSEEEGGFRRQAQAAWAGFCYVLAVTQCRAAWLGTCVFACAAIGLAAASGMRLRGKGFMALALATAFALHGWVKPAEDARGGSLERISTLADKGFGSNAERLALWGKTIRLIGGHPWLGVGAGNWKIALPSTGLSGLLDADLTVTEVRPHNDWLWVAAETGLPGGLCWLGLPVYALAYGFRRTLRKESARPSPSVATGPDNRIGILFLTCGLAGFAILSAFDFPRERAEHMAWYALGLAAILTLRPGASEADGRDKTGKEDSDPGAEPGSDTDTDPKHLLWMSRSPLAAALLLACAAALFSILRWHHEGFVKEAFAAHRAKDWPALLAAVGKLDSRICDLNPAASPMAWHSGIARFQSGDRIGAEADFRRALESHPWHLHVLYNLAVCRMAADDTAAARNYLTRVLALSPGLVQAAIQAAALSLKVGDIGAARLALDGVPRERRTPEWLALDGTLAQFERNVP
jgi:O-antigen ligase